MPDSFSQHPYIAIIARCLRRRMTSHGQSGLNLWLFTRNDVSGLGQSNEPLHFRAVWKVGLGLMQGSVAERLGVRPRNTPGLNPPESLRGIIQQEFDSEEPSTSVQQPNERLKSAWTQIVRCAGGNGAKHVESGVNVFDTNWETHRYVSKERWRFRLCFIGRRKV